MLPIFTLSLNLPIYSTHHFSLPLVDGGTGGVFGIRDSHGLVLFLE